ncbi:hypothetical protein EYF80_053023 [Liparis tanakae]|uniref:Uncharacterized protein n=1 Tax=Liparis tanakae TaxID=230148 RepID=A0A4Z2F6N4_9TELE|nr:hypothetical protein EYF80_053023 [Liparis tanakae]
MSEEIREEDGQSRSPPLEISTVYTSPWTGNASPHRRSAFLKTHRSSANTRGSSALLVEDDNVRGQSTGEAKKKKLPV